MQPNELSEFIRPAVEMYPVEATFSRQDEKWELFPTDDSRKRNQALRKILESTKGIYVFFDSQGCAIFVGKSEKQNIWKEMTSALNREQGLHTAFLVPQPADGQSFSPAWETPRQPIKTPLYFHDTAHYFSVYEVAPPLIATLAAFVVRIFCNSLSNKKMEML